MHTDTKSSWRIVADGEIPLPSSKSKLATKHQWTEEELSQHYIPALRALLPAYRPRTNVGVRSCWNSAQNRVSSCICKNRHLSPALVLVLHYVHKRWIKCVLAINQAGRVAWFTDFHFVVSKHLLHILPVLDLKMVCNATGATADSGTVMQEQQAQFI